MGKIKITSQNINSCLLKENHTDENFQLSCICGKWGWDQPFNRSLPIMATFLNWSGLKKAISEKNYPYVQAIHTKSDRPT